MPEDRPALAASRRMQRMAHCSLIAVVVALSGAALAAAPDPIIGDTEATYTLAKGNDEVRGLAT